ncbi:MAG: chromosomal replication initiator protein DnaA [Candidatus Pacebacteria bacterium]|nr:chromosomal replication initiator protein DnaA [Candidatus Paceibacterota bacterium]
MQILEQKEVKNIWDQARRDLKLQLSPAAFHTWIITNPLTEVKIIDQTSAQGVISTPSAFHATNLQKNLYSQIKRALEKALNKTVKLEFKVQDPVIAASQPKSNSSQLNRHQSGNYTQSQNFTQPSSNEPLPKSESKNANQSPSVAELFSQHNLQAMSQNQALTAAKRAGLRLDYKFSTYAIHSSNEMAHAAAQAVSKNPGQAYNPLFFYGGVGVGKTHLMQAIGHAILEKNPSVDIIYCTGEEFTNEIIDAIAKKRAIKFKKKFRTARVLMIDDIQFIAGKNTVQEEFFHTFNALTKMSSQIILTSDRPPHEINLLENRLRSRFEAGLMVDIQQPSLELRTAIVLIKAQSNNINLSLELAEMIANTLDSARKIEGLIAKLRSEVELKGKEINTELIEQILSKEKQSPANKIRLKPQKIIKKVADYYQVDQSAVKGKKRNKEFIRPRHLAMYLLKTELQMSYVEIGKWFSNRDHTSVMHAKNKLDELLETDEAVQLEFMEIKRSLLKMSS